MKRLGLQGYFTRLAGEGGERDRGGGVDGWRDGKEGGMDGWREGQGWMDG